MVKQPLDYLRMTFGPRPIDLHLKAFEAMGSMTMDGLWRNLRQRQASHELTSIWILLVSVQRLIRFWQVVKGRTGSKMPRGNLNMMW